MAKATKSRDVELELVDVASKQTLKKGLNPGFLPRAGEIILLRLGPESWARYAGGRMPQPVLACGTPLRSSGQLRYLQRTIHCAR
jgi:hypothetical protein